MFGFQYSGGVVMLLSACRAVGVRWGGAILEVLIRPMSLALVGAGATWLLIRQVGDDRFWKLALAVSGGEIVLFVLILVLGLSEEERMRIFSFFTRAWTRASGVVRAGGSKA
jgi:hypothetical protein